MTLRELYVMVEPMGFEPTTSSMPSRRAPNCATAPPKEYLKSITAGERESRFHGQLRPKITGLCWYVRLWLNQPIPMRLNWLETVRAQL